MSAKRKRRCVDAPPQSDSDTEDASAAITHGLSSRFQYTSLPEEVPAIRLLRLQPSADRNAPIQCSIISYTLEARDEDHLYEALSYTWGDPGDTREIILNGSVFHVTRNLQAALRHLRDRLFERVLWVDAVCINQLNLEEKESQIQAMASVFGNAKQVIVWLGEAGDGGDLAIHDIRSAAKGDGQEQVSPSTKATVLSLLQRSWFRRVWILQEVAMARTILLVCGHATITGHAFCTGLKNLNLPTQDHPELLARISSLAYLISAATLRPKYEHEVLGDTSLPELIDMYHDREASVFMDKVFALLSMASDAAARQIFRPNYSLSWEELFRQLVEYCLGSLVSVRFYSSRRAYIEGNGIIIGTVASIGRNSDRYDLLQVTVNFQNSRTALRYQALFGTEWTLQRTARPVEVDDVICLLQGARSPVLLRALEESFLIINIRVVARHGRSQSTGHLDRTQQDVDPFNPPLKFWLRWEWSESHIPSESLSNTGPLFLSDVLDIVEKRYQMGRCLIEMGEGRAMHAIQVLRGHDQVLGTGTLCHMASLDLTALSFRRRRRWSEAIEGYSSVVHARRERQGPRHPSTLESMTALVMTYADTCHFAPLGRFALSQTVSDASHGLAVMEAVTAIVIGSGSAGLLKAVLELSEGKVSLTSGLVLNVIKMMNSPTHPELEGKAVSMLELILESHKGESALDERATTAILTWFDNDHLLLLFERYGSKMTVTKSALASALDFNEMDKKTLGVFFGSGREHFMTDLVPSTLRSPRLRPSGLDFILERSTRVHVTDDILLTILAHSEEGPAMMHSLLSRTDCEVRVTQHGLEAAIRCEANGLRLVQALLLCMIPEDLSEDLPSAIPGHIDLEHVFMSAVGNKQFGFDLTAFLWQYGSVHITPAVVKAAASNPVWGDQLMEMFAVSMEGSLKVTESLLEAAALNTGVGYNVMSTLFRHYEFPVTADIIEAAAGNPVCGLQILDLLFSRMNTEATRITDVTLVWCARLGTADMMEALISFLGSEFALTNDMWSGLAANEFEEHRNNLLDVFLQHQGESIDIPEATLLQLVRHCDDEGIQSILGCLGPGFTLTWEIVGELLTVLQEARYYYDGNWLSWFRDNVSMSDGGVSYLLRDQKTFVLRNVRERFGRDVPITERMLEGAANNGWDGDKLMEELLSKAPEDIRVTETALNNAVAFGTAASTLSLLLARRGADAPIPDWLATQAVKNHWESLNMVKAILGHSGESMAPERLQILVETAARHGTSDVFHYLLERFGSEIQNMSAIVEAAATRSKPEILEVIRSMKYQDLVVTDRVIRAVRHDEVLTWLLGSYAETISINRSLLRTIWCATNDHPDMRETMLEYALASCRPLVLPVPETMLVELAERFDEDAVDLFLDWAEGDFQLTSRLVRAAQACEVRPRQVVWVFLQRLRPGYMLNEDVVIEIAKRCDEATLAYTLDRWGEARTITYKIIEAVAMNYRAKETMDMLLERAERGATPADRCVAEAIMAHSGRESRETVDLRSIGRAMMSSWKIRGDDSSLLSKLRRGEWIEVTEETMAEVAFQPNSTMHVVVLNRLTESVEITGTIIESVEKGGEAGIWFLRRCLLQINERFGSVQITHEAMRQTARRLNSDVLRLVLDVAKDKTYCLLPLLEAAAQNPKDADEIAKLLVGRSPSVQINDESAALVAASFSGQVMEAVLSRLGDKGHMTGKVMEAAAAHPHGPAMIRFLFSRQKNAVPLTEKMMEAAAGSQDAEGILRFLLERGARNIRITENAMVAAAANTKPDQTMAFIAAQWEGEVPLTEAVMKAAATNKNVYGLVWLTRHWGSELPITDDVLEAGMEAFGTIDGEHPVVLLLRLRGDARPITEQTMKALAGTHYTHSVRVNPIMLELDIHDMEMHELVGQLLERDHHLPITESVLRTAVTRGNERAFLRQIIARWGSFSISEDLLLEIAVQGMHWREKLHLVLGRIRYDGPIPEGVLRAAVAGSDGDEVLEYLRGRWGDGVEMTDVVMVAAAGGECAEAVLRLIAEEWGESAPMTEDILVAAADNPQYDEWPILEVILRHWDVEGLLVDKVFAAAAGHPHDEPCSDNHLVTHGLEGDVLYVNDVTALDVVFDDWERKRPVPEAAVIAAAGNRFGSYALKFLVNHWGTRAVPITDKVVEAAAGNPQGREVLLFMIWTWGRDNVPINEAVWEAARGNRNAEDILALMAERWGNHVVMTRQ